MGAQVPTREDLERLAEPFEAGDVEWRLQTAGDGARGPWGIALAYITNRAIMERLDEVCGPENWWNHYAEGPGGGVICGISIRTADGVVTKWDGAENTDVEAVKGGLSNAMKRAGYMWGIGRYLYNLSEGFVQVVGDDDRDAKQGKTKSGKSFRWYPPELPAWALPGGSGHPTRPTKAQRELEAIVAEIATRGKALAADAEATVLGQPVALKQYIRDQWAVITEDVAFARTVLAALTTVSVTTQAAA